MNNLAISPATTAERDWAARVMSESEPWITLGRGYEPCRALLAPAPDSELFIAHEGAAPAGFLFMRPKGLAGSPYIASIAVAASHRSRGVGSAMLKFADTLYAPPARHIFLCVSSFNHRARKLYERAGYARVGEIPDYVVGDVSELIMHKRLVP